MLTVLGIILNSLDGHEYFLQTTEKWKFDCIRAEMLTADRLDMSLKILDRCRKIVELGPACSRHDISELADTIASENGCLYSGLRLRFFECPVETSMLLESAFSRPDDMFKAWFLETLIGKLQQDKQLDTQVKTIIYGLTKISSKLDRVHLESLLESQEAGVSYGAVLMETIVDLLSQTGDECDWNIELIVAFVQSIDPRFNLCDTGMHWLESRFLADVHKGVVDDTDASPVVQRMAGDARSMMQVSRFCGLFVKSVLNRNRVTDKKAETHDLATTCCARLLSQFQLISDIGDSPLQQVCSSYFLTCRHHLILGVGYAFTRTCLCFSCHS